MGHVNPLTSEFEAQPAGLRRRGVVALIMLVWLAYWVGMVSQTCCQPLLSVAHHPSHTGDHDDHHDGELAAYEHDSPTDHENCPELKNADLVPAPAVALMGSASQPVLIASHHVIIPEQVFSTPFSYTLSQQTHPPPNRFLRTRRLLI